jgi:hypothetical protein
MLAAPAFGLGMWNPFLTALLKSNAASHEAFGALLCEWQGFMTRRLAQDVALMQHIAQSKSPDAVWAAYSDFWQGASHDYGRAFMTMGKIVASATSNMMPTAQPSLEEISPYRPRSRKAA